MGKGRGLLASTSKELLSGVPMKSVQGEVVQLVPLLPVRLQAGVARAVFAMVSVCPLGVIEMPVHAANVTVSNKPFKLLTTWPEPIPPVVTVLQVPLPELSEIKTLPVPDTADMENPVTLTVPALDILLTLSLVRELVILYVFP